MFFFARVRIAVQMADFGPHFDGDLLAEQHDPAVVGRFDGIARQGEIADVFDEDENLTQIRAADMRNDVPAVVDEYLVSGVDGKWLGHDAPCIRMLQASVTVVKIG